MKISKAETAIVLLAAVFLAFCVGWYQGGSRQSAPVRIETSRTLHQEEPLRLTPPPMPQGGGGQEPIDINTADVQTLCTLPGIGERRAEAIVAEREKYGPFRVPEDLCRVDGIGEKTVEGLLPFITTGEETA